MIFTLALALMMQQAHKEPPKTGDSSNIVTACSRDGQKNCANVISLTADKDGCLYPYTPDGKGRCALTIMLSPQKGLRCEPAAVHDDGSVSITCSVDPKPAVPDSQPK